MAPQTAGPRTAPDPPQAPLGPAQRLVLRPVSVTAHRDGFLVGDPARGDFVTMPAIGVVIIDALRDGRSLGQAAEVAREHAGQDVDVSDFATTLIDLGFVAEVDGRPLADPRDRRADGGRAGEWLARAAGPLFSPVAWALDGALFVSSMVALIVEPSLRPRGVDLLFVPHDPLDSLAAMFLIATLLGGLHEGAHWLATRVQGIPASISLSRRWYFLVFQTDVTGIWALPRARRLGPLLAGMAFDTTRLALLLCVRIAADAGVWHPSTLISRLLAALIAVTLVGLVFQFFICMRTDMYAVLVTWLGCLNLTRVTQLLLAEALPWRETTGRDELAHASSRDLEVARWYRWIYLSGMVAATWFLVAFFAPNIVEVMRWTAISLARTAHPASSISGAR